MPGFAYARIAAGLPMPGLILVHQWVPIGHALDDLYDIFVRGLPGGLVNTVRFIPLSPGSP